MAVTNEQISAFLAANPGMSDAQIASAMTQHGVTPAQMAQVTGLGQDVVQSRFDATQVANAPGMGTQGIGVNTAPLTVESLYQQYAGRASDPEGLAYWTKDFGDTIDPREVEVFKQAVAEARAKGTEPAAGALSQVAAQEPAITFTPGLANQTMEQKAAEYNNLLGQGFTDAQIRAAADATFGTQSASDWSALTSAAQTPTTLSQIANTPGMGSQGIGLNLSGPMFSGQSLAPDYAALMKIPSEDAVADLYRSTLGREPDQEGLRYWSQQFGADIDTAEREQFRQAAVAELTGAFGGETPDDAGLLAGFKRAKDLGISNDVLRNTLGDDLFNRYDKGLTNFAVTNLTNIIADNNLTWEESQRIHNFGRDLGFTPDDLARMTGQDKSLFELAESSYVRGRDQIIKGTLADPSVTSDADRVLAAFALQNQFKFTDEDLAQATGYDVNLIKSSLDPVRNFATTFESTVNSPDTTTAQLKTLIADSRGNAAINKMYGESLNDIETRINGIEQRWGSFQGVDPLQAENLFNQLEAQKNAIGSQYYSGVFGDTMNMAAALNRKGLETIGDLGQKDKFQTAVADKVFTGPDGQRVYQGDGANFFAIDSEGNPIYFSPDQVNTTFGKIVYDAEGVGSYVPLSAEEAATLKDDGTYQSKIGTVVIDKDTGQELTGTDGVLVSQRSGGKLTGKKHSVNVQFTPEGVPILTAGQEKTGFYDFVSTAVPMALTVASFIPGPHQPFARLANAALALEQKNYLGAVLSGLSAYGQYTGNELATLRAAEASGDIVDASRMLDLQNTLSNVRLATTFAQGATALQAENIPALINAGLSAYGQMSGAPLPSGVTTAVQLGNLGIAIENKQYDQALNALGDLTGSKDMRIAGAAKTLVDEFQKASDTGDFSGVINAGLGLADVVRSGPARTTPADQGGITNRVYDDTIVQAGADAFIRAKEAGASDEDAMAASNAATGVVINKIPDAGPSNVVTTSYLPPEEVKTERTRLANQYASSLGKTIGTLTKEEVDNFVDKVDSAIASRGSAVLKGASIQDILSGNYTTGRIDDKGFYYLPGSDVPRYEVVGGTILDAAGKIINMEEDAGPSVASNVADAIVEGVGGLEGTTGKIVKQGLSTLLSAVGEQVADLSTSLGNIGLISRNNAGVSAGKYLEDIGKRLELPETRAAVNNWVKGVSEQPTYFGKLSEGVRGVFNNPLVLTEVVKEVIQEALPVGIAAKVVKFAGIGAGVSTSTLLNSLESAGSTGRQKYDEEIAKGTPPAEAARIADRAAGYAGLITMATSGIVDSAIAKKYGDAIEDYLGRKTTSTGREFGQESFEEGMIALATGDSLADALTKSVVGGLVGGKTSGTIQTAADVQSDLATSFAAQGLSSTDGSFRPDTIVPIDSIKGPASGVEIPDVDSGDAAEAADISNSVATQIASGANPEVVVDSAITSAINSGALADAAISSAITSAVNAGADVDTVIQAATNAAFSTGNNVSIALNAGVVTINNATTGINTAVNTLTGVTTTVDSNANTTTTVDGNTTTTVDANTNTNTQTTVDANTTTSTTVDTNNNTTTQTTITGNTQTTVLTDTNTNTQTTVRVNIDTGEVEEVKETDIPKDWKQPVIEAPVVPGAPTVPTATTPQKPATPELAKLNELEGQRRPAGGFGLPSTIDIEPASLRSRETQKAIDPLARVMEAQQELENTAMMNQIDPRLLSVMQQRMQPDQPNQAQQFESDIGALARLLGGKTDTPANENRYYSYGSEDSIDDILGGMAANYAAGGYVEPLKASGGSMALPLLAKSGGALDKYNGREDFKGGKHVAGEGDGQSDDIPAWLADGEFVFSADVVAALGNGSTKAGTDKLYEMMHEIRKRARSTGPKDLPPPALKSPLDYLKSSKRSTK